MRTTTILAALAAVSGAMLIAGTAAAKGPFRAEISGGGLASPITIEGPLSGETVFLNDAMEAAPPRTLEPAYTVKLMPAEPDGQTGEYPVLMTLTYFPGDGDGPALLRGDWDSGDRYFGASAAFQAALDRAISAASAEEGDSVGLAWYLAPGITAVGLVLIGGLAGRRLLFRG
ncbi:MAG: hypothetical protein Q8Q00_00925 [Dehalococcoidia bacterium]|nr:hypothetical protein [Dehalococcoidia bacterium]